jgi:hypothetical protein
MYGMASCRFLFVDFQSDRGDFGEFYLDPTSDGEVVTYRAAVGLFSWLDPFDETDWSLGRCAGYTESQQETFGDDTFEVARIFGVLSVLCGIGMTVWTFFLSCLSLGKYQIWAMSVGLFLLTCFVGLTFLLFQSQLCKDLVSYQDESYTTECTLDQGGLVAIAGSILWCVAFLVSIIYIKAPESDMAFLPDGQISNAFDQRQLERERQKREKQKVQRKLAEQRQSEREAQGNLRKSRASSQNQDAIERGASIDCYDDGMAEVQLGSHRGASGSR